MGCDIHAFIEYTYALPSAGEPRHWLSFGGRQSERDYYVFEAMAGVRGDESKAVVPPRGFPKDAAWEALYKYTTFVGDDPKEDAKTLDREIRAEEARILVDRAVRHCFPDKADLIIEALQNILEGDRWLVSRKKAEEWLKHDSVWMNDEHSLISDPDYHTPSWISAKEMQIVARRVPTPWTKGISALMNSLAKSFGPEQVRIVFFFDN